MTDTTQAGADGLATSARHRRKLLMQLYRQGLPTQGFNIVAVAITAIVLWPVVPQPLLLVWVGWMMVLASGRLVSMRWFLTHGENAGDLALWDRLFHWGALLGGLSWGVLSFALESRWPVVYQVYLLSAFVALAGATRVAYIASLRTYEFFLAGLVTPIIISSTLSQHPRAGLFAVAALVLGVFMYLTARTSHASFVSNLSLRVANEELIENLSQINDDLSNEVRQRRNAESELVRERDLFLQGPVIVFRWSPEAGWPIEYVSPNVERFGLNADHLIARRAHFRDLIHPDDIGALMQADALRRGNNQFQFVEQDYRLVLPDGQVRWVYDRSIPVTDEFGNITHFDGYLLDITDRKQAEQSLREEKERVLVTLDSIGDGVITTDVLGTVTYLNPVAELLTGMVLEQAQGLPLQKVFRAYEQDSDRLIADPLPKQEAGRQTGRELKHVSLRPKSNLVFDVHYLISPISDQDGEAMGWVLALHDDTQMLSLNRELAYRASHDALTDTLNRPEFESFLEHAVATAREQKVSHALLYIDLDQFKVVNDTCGHLAGDELLKRISAILVQNIRRSDMLARIGGDEFGVLLHRCSIAQACSIAEKLRSAAQDNRFVWDRKIFEMGLSIGIVAIDQDSENNQAIMSAADMACYTAKDLGRNRIHVYQASDHELALRHSEMHWVSRINRALQEDRLVLYAQEIRPVTDTGGDGGHFEILLRMFDESGHLVPAQSFMSAAERFNLISTIDRWVIREAFAAIAAEQGTAPVYAVNISGSSLSQADFLSYIKQQIDLHQVCGAQICFEITETAAVSNFTNANRFVRDLKELGCRFALDDFGSGLSSFAYLKDIPVDYLKIDGSFIRNITKDSLDRALVSAINDVGHVMLIDTVAEFVEDKLTFEEVRKIGIDYAQGSYIGEPTPLGTQQAKLENIPARARALREVS